MEVNKFLMQKDSKNVFRFLVFNKVECNCTLFKYGLCSITSSQGAEYRKERK